MSITKLGLLLYGAFGVADVLSPKAKHVVLRVYSGADMGSIPIASTSLRLSGPSGSASYVWLTPFFLMIRTKKAKTARM